MVPTETTFIVSSIHPFNTLLNPPFYQILSLSLVPGSRSVERFHWISVTLSSLKPVRSHPCNQMPLVQVFVSGVMDFVPTYIVNITSKRLSSFDAFRVCGLFKSKVVQNSLRSFFSRLFIPGLLDCHSNTLYTSILRILNLVQNLSFSPYQVFYSFRIVTTVLIPGLVIPSNR